MTLHSLAGFVWRQQRAVLLFLTVWTVFVAMEVAKDWYTFRSAGWAFYPGRHIGQSAFIFYRWFLISVLIGAFAWYESKFLNRMHGFAIHALLSVAFGLLHLFLIVVSIWIFFPGRMANSSLVEMYVKQGLSWFHFEILVYFAVLFIWRNIFQSRDAQVRTSQDQHQEIDGRAGGEKRVTLPTLLVGRIDGEKHITPLALIDWIEAAGNSVIAHAGDRGIKVNETLKSLTSRLDQSRFIRVHRSAVINIDRLRHFSGMNLVMRNGDRVVCSRSGKWTLGQLLAESQR